VLPVTRTFKLAYADAQEVADNVLELFEATGDGTRSVQRTPRTAQRNRQPQQPNQGGGGTGVPTIGPEIELTAAAGARPAARGVAAAVVAADRRAPCPTSSAAFTASTPSRTRTRSSCSARLKMRWTSSTT
jgi:hypothetical protein